MDELIKTLDDFYVSNFEFHSTRHLPLLRSHTPKTKKSRRIFDRDREQSKTKESTAQDKHALN